MNYLRICNDLNIPLSAVTSTFAILAKRGSGKSNVAVAMAEEFYKLGAPWVAVDPKGDWFGIRSSKDGKKPGLPIPVFGGTHGDVPLEATAGKMIADLIVEKRLTCVLDTSEFSKTDQTKFMMDFFDRIYRKNKKPLHIFLEEADEAAPQRVFAEMARLVYLVSKIAKLGRTRGLGITAITQRSASFNKDVLTQIETLIVLRTTAPQDRAKIEEWVEEHEIGKEAVATLSSLEDGEGWVWSPHFLKTMKRVRFRRRETFDSGKTPELDEEDLPPATLADINLDEIRKVMADTIEKAKAEDPKELQRQVADLKRQLAAKPAVPAVPMIEIKKVEVPVLRAGEIKLLKRFIEMIESCSKQFGENKYTMESALDNSKTLVEEMKGLVHFSEQDGPVVTTSLPGGSKVFRKSPVDIREEWAARAFDTPTNTNLEKAQVYILIALAQYGTARDGKQLALLSGYRYNRHMRNNLSALRTAGYITGENMSPITITHTGIDILGNSPSARLQSPDHLAEHWLNQFDKQPRTILSVLLSYPHGTDHKNLCEQTGYTYNRHFRNSLSDLRSAGVLIGPNMGTMKPASELV